MKDVQKELLSISTALASLVTKVEKMVDAIDAEGGKAAPAKKAKATKTKKAPAKRKAKKAAKAKSAPKKKAAKKAKKKKAPAKAAAKAASPSGATMLDSILGMISRSRNGITVERLKKRTGLAPRQVSNALYKLTKKGRIETLSRGVYVKKKS